MKNPFQAYHRANYTVPKIRQVVMLYDGVTRNLAQAREAMESKDVSTRYNKLTRASEIIIGLQMSLDFEQGADTAQILYDFYSSLDARIFALHRHPDIAHLDQIIKEWKDMREMWNKIDTGELPVDSASAGESAEIAPQPMEDTARSLAVSA